MGFTQVRVHVRKKEASDAERLEQFLEGMGVEAILLPQNEYLTIDSYQVSFENFEEIAMGISGELALNVLVGFVFDSDVAVVHGYINGDKVYEEVKSIGECQEMDREMFLKDFFPACDSKAFNDVLDNENHIFAEDYLFELGDALGIKFFEE
ncbi:MAG: hypothetical protein IIT46_07040 [Lachnospiraceae bacterium]|nr:hypothetical protein [Lachnospiraceae bacterium]